MKKYLISENGNFYKANLHCHSTVSDGKRTPEELKAEYMEHGYSIIAYTDHNAMIPHHELTDENFLALTGFEINLDEIHGVSREKKVCHICLIALDKENTEQICYHRTLYLSERMAYLREFLNYDESLPDYVREYTPECVNDIIKTAREKGFFVTYNHPAWSLESYGEYINYNGMHAMEICNYGCVVEGYCDNDNSMVYDDMLKNGKRIFCIATDDNHNKKDKDDRGYDSFGGYTVIKADKLEYGTITDALVKGNFYASQGPEIHELWFEDGEIHIKCSPADRIVAIYGIRRGGIEFSQNSEGICEAKFPVKPEDNYVRLMVFDQNGKYAATNAYFCDELYR